MAAALAASNPVLYRHLALYLQVLRQVLPARVEQACFHLATQVHPQRYAALPDQERQALHGRILALVQRCTSLLTVEQLTALADQIDREAQHRQRRQQRELLQQLSSGATALNLDATEAEAEADAAGQSATDRSEDPGLSAADRPLPAGSIRLDFSLPLSGPVGGWRAMGPPTPELTGLDGLAEAEPQEQQPLWDPAAANLDVGASAAGSNPADAETAEADGSGADDDDDFDTEDQELDPSEFDPQTTDPDASDPEVMELAADSLEQRLAQGPDAAAILKIVREAMDDSRDRGRQVPAVPDQGTSSPWRDGQLPRDPITLLRWLDGLEKALLRRLRNLSHALNVELLRVGISRGLLPVSLLDAVLEGQVDTMASPSNVLHLQLPFSLRPGMAEVHALAILLRPVDLEMDEPRLRTCRRRLQQQRQELRRMAHQYRRLQRRLQAHEAERLWLQDIRKCRPPQA